VYLMGPNDERVLMCSTCGDFYNSCLYYLSVVEVCERYHRDADFKGNVDVGRANYLSKDPPPFEQEQVSRATTYELGVERRFTILNDRDWKKAFGEEPRAKVTRYSPSIELQSETGELETYFLFEYSPASPYRTLVLRRATLSSKHAEVLPKASHVYETQADDVVSQQSADHLEQVLAALSNTRLTSLDEKLYKRKALAGGGGGADGSGSVAGGACRSIHEGSEPGSTPRRPSASPPKVLGDDIPVLPRRSSAAASSSAAHGLPPPAAHQDAGHEMASVVGSARGRGRFPPRAGGSSTAGSGQKVGSPTRGPDGPLDLQTWVRRLDLSDAMAGKAAKLSVHHAEAAVKRWSNSEAASKKNDAKRLKEHLQLHALAESVSPSK